MILSRQPSGIFAIKQADHAALAGFLLEHWSDHRFSKNDERDKIVLATRKHDCGWEAFDNAPRIDQRTHLPVDFAHINADEAYDIWKRATDRFAESDLLITLLITHHAYTLHELTHRRDGVWKQFLTEFAQQRAELRTQLGMTHNQLEHAYSFLRMMDWFSLAYCMNYTLGAEKPEKYSGYSLKRDGNQYLFRPYPFTEKDLRYPLPVYPMRKGGYKNEQDLRDDLQTPEYQEVIFNPLERFVKN